MRLLSILSDNDNGFFFSVILTAKAAKSRSFLSNFAERIAYRSSLGEWRLAKSSKDRILVAAQTGFLPQAETPLLFWITSAGGRSWQKLLVRDEDVPDAVDFQKSYCINLSKEKQLNGSKEVIGMHCWLDDDSSIITTTAKYILKDGVFALLILASNPDGGDSLLLPRYQDAIRLAFGDGYRKL